MPALDLDLLCDGLLVRDLWRVERDPDVVTVCQLCHDRFDMELA